MNPSLQRRHFLRGLGAGIALPALHSLIPSRVLAESAKAAARGKAGLTASGMPLRMAFLYHPNGANMEKWVPTGAGKEFEFNETQKPFAKYRNDFQIITGLEHKNGTAGGDGGGDHARANATFLTGMRPRKTAGADIKLGISVDQVAANAIGEQTRFASLELSCDGVRKNGTCDSGYSCAYQFNLSWRSENTPMTPEANPRLVFERLFGSGTKEERQRGYQMRQAQQRSILDFVLEDARAMEKALGNNDRMKLDEYLNGVREIERRIQKAESFGPPPDPGQPAPDGVPESYEEHIRLMMDMIVLAFETDSTRVASFLLAHDGSNRSFKEDGVPDGHHSISHHQRKAENLDKLAKIDLFYSRQFAYFLDVLSSKKDTDGKSLLHNSMIVWGSGLADPDRHSHSKLPIVLAGHAGGGRFSHGRHIDLGTDMPMSNLYLSLLDTMGVKADTFGDATGRMPMI